MHTDPQTTVISPVATGMPAILAFNSGQVEIETPLGRLSTDVEVVIEGPGLEHIQEMLASMASPDHLTRLALDDLASWRSSGRPVHMVRAVSEDGSIVTARVAATSLNEAVSILGALSTHRAAHSA